MTHHGPGLGEDEYLKIARDTYPQSPAVAAKLLRESVHGATREIRLKASEALAQLDSGVLPKSPLVKLTDRLKSALDELDRLQNGDFSRYVSTGIPSLDRRLGGGLRRGEVALLAAPTGSGKTTAIVQMAVAAGEKGLAVVVSPEMSPEQLVTREVVRRSGVPKWHRAPWATASMQADAATAHTKAASEIAGNPPNVAIYDAAAISLADVFDVVRAESGPLSMVALDYAQQLADEDPKKSRYLAVGEVASRSIALAQELDCVVIVTSQVNTFREKGAADKSYSIRESANLEQKAATVLYLIVDRGVDGRVEKAEFRATKVRDGALFRLEVSFDPSIFSITDKLAEPVMGDDTLKDWTQ